MKSTITLLLALALVMSLLTSCEMFVPGPAERPPIDSTEPTESVDPSQSQTLWQEGVGPDFDRRFSTIGCYVCATEDTVYFSTYGSNLIHYVDKTTGICLPLCGKPECLHMDDTCNAYLYGGYGIYCLTNYGGRLYWVGQDKNTPNWCIFSVAYDGTDRRVHRELDEDVIGNSFTNWNLQFHRGYLYWSYQAKEIVDAEAREIARVIAFPIDSDGESFVIFEEDLISGASLNIQSYGDNVYINISGEDGDGFFLHLYRWNVREGKRETLYYGKTPCIVRRNFWATEDGIMLLGNVPTGPEEDPWASQEYNVYRFSFESGEIVQMYQFWAGGNINITVADGVFIGNTVNDSRDIRLSVKDFEGQTVLDTIFESVEWYSLTPFVPMNGSGMDESYLYFNWLNKNFIAIPRDGSEIKLLWSRGSESS